MSPENRQPKRRYEQRARAESRLETRRRITEATVELHGTVGPARTTVSEIAKRAGVERPTVYRHFPDEKALYAACSAHWAARNPMPDPAPWRAIADPRERLVVALTALYGWYRGAGPMLANVLRDAELVPELAEVNEQHMGPRFAALEDLLAEGWGRAGARARRAAIALALDFGTWRLLAHERGLSDADAARLMAGAVASVRSAA